MRRAIWLFLCHLFPTVFEKRLAEYVNVQQPYNVWNDLQDSSTTSGRQWNVELTEEM